jgi:chemotaxis protein MotB
MYAVSSINSSKFQEMAEAFSTAFTGKTTKPQATGLAAGHKAPFEHLPSPVRTPIVTREMQVKHLPPALRQEIERRMERLNSVYERLTRLLGDMIRKGQVHVSLQSLGVVIDINAIVLFKSGKAELTPEAFKMIDKIAAIIKDLHYPIQVNGFTDNTPIHNAQFSSNWDLSAARAMAVVKRFVASGIDPTLLVGAGYGKYHPVASNGTPEGKAMNRRVSIVVVSAVEDHGILKIPLLGVRPEKGAAGRDHLPAGGAATAAPPAGAPRQ